VKRRDATVGSRIGAPATRPERGLRAVVRATAYNSEGVPGTWEVVDRMPRGPRRIDLYFGDDEEAAREFGNRRVRIQWEAP
jgi:hypothetical protein